MIAYQAELIRVLRMAHLRRLPPALLVRSLADEKKGRQRRALTQLADLLDQGVAVVDAVEQTPDALAPLVATQLRLASQTGALKETYDDILADDTLQRSVSNDAGKPILGQWIYTALAFFVTWMIMAFLMVFIVPTLEKMFDEFGIELPSSMVALIALSRYGGLLFLLGILVFGGLLYWETRYLSRNRKGLASKSDGGHLLNLLAMLCQSGRPLTSGLTTLARYHPVAHLRQQLQSVVEGLSGDANPWKLLQQADLLKVHEAEALQLAQTSSSRAWLLRQAAIQRRSRLGLSGEFWASLVAFGLLMVLAGMVGLAAIAMFSTLYSLVETLA